MLYVQPASDDQDGYVDFVRRMLLDIQMHQTERPSFVALWPEPEDDPVEYFELRAGTGKVGWAIDAISIGHSTDGEWQFAGGLTSCLGSAEDRGITNIIVVSRGPLLEPSSPDEAASRMKALSAAAKHFRVSVVSYGGSVDSVAALVNNYAVSVFPGVGGQGK